MVHRAAPGRYDHHRDAWGCVAGSERSSGSVFETEYGEGEIYVPSYFWRHLAPGLIPEGKQTADTSFSIDRDPTTLRTAAVLTQGI